MNHAVQLMGQHPALTYGNIFEIRPAADISEIVKASEHGGERKTLDRDAHDALQISANVETAKRAAAALDAFQCRSDRSCAARRTCALNDKQC